MHQLREGGIYVIISSALQPGIHSGRIGIAGMLGMRDLIARKHKARWLVSSLFQQPDKQILKPFRRAYGFTHAYVSMCVAVQVRRLLQEARASPFCFVRHSGCSLRSGQVHTGEQGDGKVAMDHGFQSSRMYDRLFDTVGGILTALCMTQLKEVEYMKGSEYQRVR